MRMIPTCALVTAVALPLVLVAAPALFWRHAAMSWWTLSALLGVQHQCITYNPVLEWLFAQAEQAALAQLRPGKVVEFGQVRELAGEDYTWAKLGEVSDDYTHPVVVRGLFKGIAARDQLADPNYWADTFPEAVARGVIPYGRVSWAERCDDRDESQHGDNFSFRDMAEASRAGRGFKSSMWVAPEENHTTIIDAVEWADRLGTEELSLVLKVPGMIFTQSSADTNATLSSDWHQGFGPNMAVHLAGSKRWDMIAPWLIHLMRPTWWEFSSRSYVTEEVLAKVPPAEVVVHAGDALFVPSWWWHTVHHHGPKEFTVLATTRMVQGKQMFQLSPYGVPCVLRDVISNAVNVYPSALRDNTNANA